MDDRKGTYQRITSGVFPMILPRIECHNNHQVGYIYEYCSHPDRSGYWYYYKVLEVEPCRVQIFFHTSEKLIGKSIQFPDVLSRVNYHTIGKVEDYPEVFL